MATTVAFEDEMLKLIFNATAIPNIAVNATTTPATNLHVSLHTEDPAKTTSSSQSASEVDYTAYARIPVLRTTAGWTVSQGKVVTASTISFPAVADVTGNPDQATHFGVGEALTGAGKLMFSGALNPPITLSNGVVPRIDNQSPASRFDPSWA